MYESPTQTKPTLDCKGIETIRRDTCKVVSKTMDHTLRLLFDTLDLSLIKQYLQRQWYKMIRGRIPLSDLIFAKEVKIGTYRSSAPPPAAIVAAKRMSYDKQYSPAFSERIP